MKDPVTGKPVRAEETVVDQASRDEYDAFDDYLEMVIEYGYITLFASAFPLCSLLSIISNYVELRSDAFKLSHVMRRPHSSRVLGIGSWMSVLQLMTMASIVTNCFLFGFASDQMEAWFPTLFRGDVADTDFGKHIAAGKGRYVVLIVFLVEHVLLLFHALVHFCIDDRPKDVRLEEARTLHQADLKVAEQRQALLRNLWTQKQEEEEAAFSGSGSGRKRSLRRSTRRA